MRPPMPHNAVTGRWPIVSIHVRRVRRATPPGLANPVAVFACSFVSPMPMAHDRPVSSSTRALIAAASASGSSTEVPTNASSHPHTSTITGNERSVAITRSDAAS